MPDPRGESLRHIIIENTATAEPYTYPRPSRGPTLNLPGRSRQSHGDFLLERLEAARHRAELLDQQRKAVGISGNRGLYLEFQSEPDFELAIDSLDRKRERIELVAVRERDDTQFATVYVPQGRLENLERLVTRYIEEDHQRWGQPKNKKLVESITDIRRAVLRSFWTDDQDLFPDETESIWWEVWLRAGDDQHGILEDFYTHAHDLELTLKPEVIFLPERTVLLSHATGQQMSQSVELLDCIAELRKAKDPPSFFIKLNPWDQEDWVKDLRRRLSVNTGDLPAVCILDTGINRGHPLIQQSLDEADLHTYNPDWGVADHEGHGTEMAGIALLGDLTPLLSSKAPVISPAACAFR